MMCVEKLNVELPGEEARKGEAIIVGLTGLLPGSPWKVCEWAEREGQKYGGGCHETSADNGQEQRFALLGADFASRALGIDPIAIGPYKFR